MQRPCPASTCQDCERIEDCPARAEVLKYLVLSKAPQLRYAIDYERLRYVIDYERREIFALKKAA